MADVIEHPEEILVWLANLPAEAFDDTQNRIAQLDGETESRVQSFFLRQGHAREMTVPGHIANPRWFAIAPDATRQTDSRSKRALPRDRFKFRNLHGRGTPEFHAVQLIGLTIHAPDGAAVPSTGFT